MSDAVVNSPRGIGNPVKPTYLRDPSDAGVIQGVFDMPAVSTNHDGRQSSLDVISTASQSFGSLPTVTTDIAPVGSGPTIYPTLFWGSMAEHGPQLDMLTTNTGNSDIQILQSIRMQGAKGAMSGGAKFTFGAAGAFWPVNTSPGTITSSTTDLVAGDLGHFHNNTGSLQDFMMSLLPVDQVPVAPVLVGTAITLAPGDFVWFSVKALVRSTGFGAGSFASLGLFGSGFDILHVGLKV